MSMFYSITSSTSNVQRVLYRFPLFIIMYPKKYRDVLHDGNSTETVLKDAWRKTYKHYSMDMMLSRSLLALVCAVNFVAITYSSASLRG